MNRKLLVTVLALAVVLLAAPFIGLAQAGKGQTKLYYEFFLQGVDLQNGDLKITKDNIYQVRHSGFQASFIEVTVGGNTFYPDPASYVGLMDLTLDLNTMQLNIRVHESFVVAGGVITQDTAEVVYNYGLPNMAGGGSFVGFGSGALEGVKIQGTSQMVEDGLDRVGTVMGWP